MIYWIKRSGRLFGTTVFFMVFFCVLLQSHTLQLINLTQAFILALISGIVCWFVGIVISDVVLKGILTDMDDIGVENMLEGGIVQRFQMMQERLVPGGAELPFDEITTKKKDGKNKKKKK